MKRVIQTISMLLIGIIMTMFFVGCSPKADKLEIEKDVLVVAVGETASIHYEITPRKDDYKLSWTTSDESIATVVDGYYGYFGRVTGKSTGECTITLKMGGKTDTIDIKVVIDPDVDVYPAKGNKFTIFSDLPIGTKLKVNLKGNEFDNTSVITLIASEVGSKYELFADEDLMGEYTLTIELPLYEEQTNEVKEILGENYKYVDFNKELFVRTYTLPYKSDIEIICETPYSQLTEGQRIKISQWLKDKYDLYRKKYNGYWMDDENGVSRPILSIVQEMGAERYNKTYEQMVELWHYYILGIRN